MVCDMDKVSIKQKLGKSIAKARIAQDMTQEAVAEKLGIASVGCLKMPAQTVGCAPLGAHALFVLNACLKDDFCFEEKRFVCFRQALRAGNAFAPEGKYSMITGYGLLDVN